ncbi:glycoside hydrolase family 57 protein [Candidatus Cyanaurora vandensis]|uniref:glycoside hydrolase family 57 protein n=1 Tax=Candidatus Cyanaurora vandensis TaxID=2714958 RepID=UPI00257B8430|nr:1,4-alpha-glucan branching protein domain-containing protein [Candidatus Cyanaurora vandensis]
MALGYLALVLHAHLPYVRHPETGYVLEEEWLFEAITETYVPLIRMFEGLELDGIDFRLTMSMTPPLVAMLEDPYLQDKYDQHLTLTRELVAQERERTKGNGHLQYLVSHYETYFQQAYDTWHRYGRDLVRAFKYYQDRGNLDILTCGATHGYLPLMQMYPQAVWAQLKVAVDSYGLAFDQAPKGIWLAECAYFPGLERMIADVGLRYFITDAHGILYAKPRPRYGPYAPIFSHSGVAVFGRDYESSQQVWSSEVGYPGDPAYREFYKDLGYEADYEYIKPYIIPNGTRKNTGIKYHRITSRTGALEGKELYDPYWAREKAAAHASNFMENRVRQVGYLNQIMGREPIVLSPYDAELFGHWWYEGPWFLDYLIRKSTYDQQTYRMTHLAEYLQLNPTQQVATPAQSSWGAKGFHEYWLNDTNDWIYPHLHKAAERMIELSKREPQDEWEWRALNQCARELLLAQSSDWAFIMRTATMVPYAIRRTRSHLLRFNRLYEALHKDNLDRTWLEKVEVLDNIFPEINYRVYRPL